MGIISSLIQLESRGNSVASHVLDILKSATIGRNECFGATNSLMTSDTGLLSPKNLVNTKQGPNISIAGAMPLGGMLVGQAPSTGGQPGFAKPPIPMSGAAPLMKNSSLPLKSDEQKILLIDVSRWQIKKSLGPVD